MIISSPLFLSIGKEVSNKLELAGKKVSNTLEFAFQLKINFFPAYYAFIKELVYKLGHCIW